jgi:hypothetical protein
MIWGCPQKLFYSYMAKPCAFHCLYNLAIRFVTRLGDNFTIKNLAPSRRKAKSKSPRKWQLESSLHLFGAIEIAKAPGDSDSGCDTP